MANVIFANDQNDLCIRQDDVLFLCQNILELLGKAQVELGVYLVNEERICQLHQEYFDDPSFTDCITFPIDREDPKGYLGEVFICPKAALIYTQENGGDPYIELSRYIIHTLLHLLGHDDQSAQERKKMRYLENKYLNLLKTKDLLLKNPKSL